MIRSILAGIMISLGGIIYLSCPNQIVGAILFSIGLLTILHFQWRLFTGKAGLLATKDISFSRLMQVLLGNGISCIVLGLSLRFTNWGRTIVQAAAAIVEKRIDNNILENFILGVFCGILMYIAVTSYSTKPFVTVMCVAAFILAGFNHCIADMFYYTLGTPLQLIPQMLVALAATICGNVCGCNIIPLLDYKD